MVLANRVDKVKDLLCGKVARFYFDSHYELQVMVKGRFTFRYKGILRFFADEQNDKFFSAEI